MDTGGLEIFALPTDGEAIKQGCYFDVAEAQRAIQFFRKFLSTSKGEWAGQPFPLLPWQSKLLATLFGWKRPDGTRRYRRAYIEIPKKNGKSTLASGIALYMLVADREQGAEVYLAANDKKQAGIVFNECLAMTKSCKGLSAKLKCVPTTKHIAYHKTNSFIEALSADVESKEGMNAHCIIWDELHSYKSRRMWDTLSYATAARRQPLQIAITTAGVYNPEQIGWLEHEYAKSVLEGTQDLYYLPVIFAANETDDWEDPAVWQKANPSLGHTVSFDSFKEDFNKAKSSPRDMNKFKRYRLNIWTATLETWLMPEDWLACKGELTLEEIKQYHIENKTKCWLGLDLSKRSDLTAATLIFPLEDGTVDILTEAWIPRDCAIEKENKDRVPYQTWADQGLIHFTPGNVIDHNYVCKRIIELCNEYNVTEVAYDRALSTWLLGLFREYGVIDGAKCPMIEFACSPAQMSEPIKEFETLVKSHKLRHGGNDLLTWQANNATLWFNKGGQCLIEKSHRVNRVDSIVSACMALGRYMVRPEEKPKINYVSFI